MDLSIQTLRIFCAVVTDGSFSKAARALKIAQPTVSQQIARIEQVIGGRLFERVGKVIHLTQLGQDFYTYAEKILEMTDSFSETLRDEKTLPSGLVKYAMPESCQWTPHYRKIMNQIKNFPDIRFEIEILPNAMITQLILEGKIDFGFVTGERLNPELRFEKFSDEHYSMLANDNSLFEPLAVKEISKMRIISFPGWEPFFEIWAKANGYWDNLKTKLPLPIVRVGTLAGAIHATQEGAGISVIPSHCVSDELAKKELFSFPQQKNKQPISPVHIVRRSGEKLSHRSELVLEMLRKAKSELG